MATHVGLAGCLLVAVAAGVRAGLDDDAPARRDPDAVTTSSTSTTAAAASSATTSVTVSAADATAAAPLADLLPDTPGPGFTRTSDVPSDGTGPLDLAAAAAAEADVEAERSRLVTRGFAAGWGRAWTGPDGVRAYVSVYRFGAGDGAAAYLRDGLEVLEGRGARLTTSDVAAGAMAFSQATETSAGARVASGVVASRGAHFVLAFTTGASGGTGADVARQLAIATVRRLPE